MTRERQIQFHKALEQAGTKDGAAKLLDVCPATVSKAIEEYPEMGSYLATAQPPSEQEVMARQLIKPMGALAKVNEGPEATARAMTQLEAKFRTALGRAGVKNKEELDKVIALQALGATHFTQIRQFHSGSLLDLYLSLKREFDKLTEDLNDGDFEDAEFEKMLREDRGRVVSAMIQIGDRLDKSLLTAALVEAKRNEKVGGKQHGRPGFNNLTKVEVNTTGPVTVSEAN